MFKTQLINHYLYFFLKFVYTFLNPTRPFTRIVYKLYIEIVIHCFDRNQHNAG